MDSKNILVCGATGQQGGAVVKAILKDGHQVTGITRNPESAKANQLKKQGVKMICVNFTNKDLLIDAMQHSDTVFAMTTPFEGGVEHEIEQGITLANAAHQAGVNHFIFNSVGGANLNTGIPHFESKYEVEKHLASIDLPTTIIGPTYFMDNLFFPFMIKDLASGILKMAMPEDRVLQQISVEDIGKFVAQVVNRRDEMIGLRIDIAGDELTGSTAAEILSNAIGQPIEYVGYSPEYLRGQSEDLALMYEWFNNYGYTTDLQALEEFGFANYTDWAANQDWKSILKA